MMTKPYIIKMSRIVIRYGKYTVDFCILSMCNTFDVAQVMEDLRNNPKFFNGLTKCLMFVFRLRR